MTEPELRALVRDAIERHGSSGARGVPRSDATAASPPPVFRQHSSHAMFAVPEGADTGGPCIIEPAVACNHCGYCKSYGH